MVRRPAAWLVAMLLISGGAWASSTLQVNAGTPYIFNGTCTGAFPACQASGEVHAINGNSVFITQNQGGTNSTLTDPVLIILGIAGTGNVAPTLEIGTSYGGYTITSGGLVNGTVWGDTLRQTSTSPAGVLLSSDTGPNDAYSQVGLSGLGALGELGVNWSAAYSSVFGSSVSQFQLFVYSVDLSPDLTGKGTGNTFEATFSNLSQGTFVTAYGCQGQTDTTAPCSSTNPNPFGTPFTESGMKVPRVPEPALVTLLGTGLLFLGGVRRKVKC